MTRRAAISLVTTPLLARGTRKTFDPNFGSGLDAAAAIRARTISSVELTNHVFERIDRFQPRLNAFVYQMREEALVSARRIDEAVAGRERRLPPLAGVPVVVKESFGVAGRPCTWGIPALKSTRAVRNSTAVQRLLDAGAVIVGATNVPFELTDGQSYNDIYGTTNNPWELTRTPGGSSGGTAAALAAGLGFLGIGSDLAGSIRSPAHCCGIFGHKPTLDVVSLRGQAPGGVLADPGFSTLLAVAGPLARTAQDLEAALDVLGGPEMPDSIAYTWRLPKARHEQLREFLLPALPVAAFPHDHTDKETRQLETPEGPLAYMKALRSYASVATITGCPATVAPAGKTPNGLPVGIQILGPYLEDVTTIRLAGFLARENGGFTPPPGYLTLSTSSGKA